MNATIQMLKNIVNGHTYEHSECVDPFDDIIIKSKAYVETGYNKGDFIIETYEDNSLIETQRISDKRGMLSAMRTIGREWE